MMELSRYESRRNRRLLTIAASMVAAGLTAFAVYDGVAPSSTESAVPPGAGLASVVPVGKTGLKRVVLTAPAARRLDIRTARVGRAIASGRARPTIPYSAVLYDANGDTWTYTSPKPLVFVRHDIRVATVDGEHAILTAGPRPGTRVVTVGSAELWGIEYGEIEED
jgi:hypothetical protein